MHRLILTALLAGVSSPAAFGGFKITRTATTAGLPTGLQQIDLYALNTGNGTGTGLLTFEFDVDSFTGSRVFFRSTSTGTPNILNSTETPYRSYFRVDDDDLSSSVLVYRSPTSSWTLAPDQGALTVGQEDFSVTVASLEGAKPAYTGAGAHFAQLITNIGYAGKITGSIAGETGAAVPIGMTIPEQIDEHFIVVVSPSPQTVTFGNVVSSGLSFSATVTATDADPSGVLTLTAGTLPAGVSNIAVARSVNGGVTSFVVTGLLNYSTNKTTVIIPVNVSDGVATFGGTIVLNVVPEPASIAIIGGLALVGRRRRH